MSSKSNHSSRSRRNSHNRPYGMYAMDQNSNLKTMQRRRIKEIRDGRAS